METQFAEGTLAVQVIVLVQPPVSLEDAPLRETLKAVLAAPVARRVLALGGPGEDCLICGMTISDRRASGFGLRKRSGAERSTPTSDQTGSDLTTVGLPLVKPRI